MIKNQINKSYDNVVQETLIAARMLISDKSSWGIGAFAGTGKNYNSDEILGYSRFLEPYDYNASCWCGVGAIKAFSPDSQVENQCGNMLFIAADTLGHDADWFYDEEKAIYESRANVIGVNDTTDHKTVLQVFDAAIALCEF